MVKGRYFLPQRDKRSTFRFNSIFAFLINELQAFPNAKYSFTRKENAVSSDYNSLPAPYPTSLPLPNKIHVFSFILSFPGN